MARSDPMLRIRVPQDVKDWLEQSARKNLRSQGAEVAFLLREKMAEEADAQN